MGRDDLAALSIAPATKQFLRQLGRECPENAPEIQDATPRGGAR